MTDFPASPHPPEGSQPAATVVIDPHSLIREGLCRLLAEAAPVRVVFSVASPLEVRAADAGGVALAIIRLDGDESAIFSQVKEARSSFPRARLLVVAPPRIAPLAARLLRSGVHGFFLTDSNVLELGKAVTTVLRGEPYLNRELAEELLREPEADESAGTNPATALSDRELEIFCLVGNGRTTRQIAEALFISRKTVEAHKENIKNKLGLESAAELARTAALWVGNDTTRAIA